MESGSCFNGILTQNDKDGCDTDARSHTQRVHGRNAGRSALAVQPVSAETITTDSESLLAGEVKIPVQGGALPAYRAMPAAGGQPAVVLVVREIFGVHEHIKDICRRLAKRGYVAIAPELFARHGDVSKLSNVRRSSRPSSPKFPTRKSWRTSMPRLHRRRAPAPAIATARIAGFCWVGVSCRSTPHTTRT